ncbi:hypothetical protein KIM67_02990 [Flagellimonas sp. 389]|uniref:hypothetical protein n=1 Tax=Flagellimonas sp. 389 TaxID=2835862 RepID=UPI001BD2F9A8|nr:hypothetical protein [Flagellimonas sp. 389]MBS9461361.1 hypothetical protein [Flagellimonas sp. 389]
MLKRTVKFCCLVLVVLSTSSCFDILEEINLNKDGSGTLLFTVNMSKSKTKIASLMLLDSVNGYKVPTENDIELALNDVVKHLEKSEGITNIKKTKDFGNYIFSVSCNFEDIASLNGITSQLIKEQNRREKTNFNTSNFAYDASKRVFERKFKYDSSIKKSFDYLKKEDKKIFQDASFTSIYRFDEPVQAASNSNAKIAPSKKAVMLRIDAMSFILGEKTIQNKIQLIN